MLDRVSQVLAQDLWGLQLVAKLVCRYHQYDIKNAHYLPPQGSCIIAVNHSFASYEFMLLGQRVFEITGRIPYALADKKFSKLKK